MDPRGQGGWSLVNASDEKEMIPLKQGGTGSRSEFEEQPDFLPDCFESGTPNGVGLAGLLAGVQFVLEKGVEQIRQNEITLIEKLIKGLKEIPQVKLYGPELREIELPLFLSILHNFLLRLGPHV